MKVVIFGCNGYLGKHLSDFLIKKNWHVIGYDLSKKPLVNISEYKIIDLTKKAMLYEIDINVDFIFYFSGITGTSNGFDLYRDYINVNEIGLLNLLNYCKTLKSTARFIFPSTRLIYKGVKNKALDENAEKEFKTVYAINKWAGEQYVMQYNNCFNLNYTIFRIGVPYANLFSKNYSYGTVGFFMNKASNGEDIVLYGDGSSKRSFTHVEDICSQIFNAINNKSSLNKIFNISGETLSLKDVAILIASKCDVNVTYRKWPVIDKKLESGDTIFNSNAIIKITSNSPKHIFKTWLNSITLK